MSKSVCLCEFLIFDSVTLALRALISGSKIQILHEMQMNNIGSILNAFQEHVARSLLITISIVVETLEFLLSWTLQPPPRQSINQ